jgi:hypothetical protein
MFSSCVCHASSSGQPPTVPMRSLHYVGVVLLFLFLVFGAYCQFEVWAGRDRLDLARLERIWFRWYAATKLMPAVAALIILITGARLYAECVESSVMLPYPATATLMEGHTFWLFVLFACLFVDGLTGYLPYVCCLRKAAARAAEDGLQVSTFNAQHRSRAEEVILFCHALSFPFVLALPALKPRGLWVPLGIAKCVENLFGKWPVPLARGAHVIVLVLVVGAVILAIRLIGLIKRIRFLITRECYIDRST